MHSKFLWFSLTSLLVLITAIIEFISGRLIICKCGYIKLWEGDTISSGNSQHLTDFYSFSHIIHGFIFYFLLFKFAPKLNFGQKLFVAGLVEALWEIVENSSFIINRYRQTTMSQDYSGDSIINSVFDILAMILGFYLASKLPVWLTITLLIIMELGVGFLIRDNLTLNIIMLIYPFKAIKNWQING